MSSNLTAFIAAIDANVRLTEETLRTVIRRVATIAGENVVVGGDYAPGTPVDTGFARGSWWVSVNTITGAPASQGDISSLVANLAEVNIGDVVYWLNNAEYIPYLEDGWSSQAPAGFVKLVVNNGQIIVDRVVREVRR